MGKDLDLFTTPLPDHLHCPVCLAAAYPPIAVCSAEHILCQSCVGDIFTTEQAPNCPTCRERMPPQLKVAQGFKRAIEGYSYKCEHDSCSWVGSVGDEAQHLACSCEYRIINCKLCATPLRAKDQDAHLDASATVLMQRRELQAHEAVCAMFPCRVPDCPTRTVALNLPMHEKECLAQRKRIAQLENQLAHVQGVLVMARAAVDSLSVKRNMPTLENKDKRIPTAARPSGVVGRMRKRQRKSRTPEILELSSSDSEDDEGAEAADAHDVRPVEARRSSPAGSSPSPSWEAGQPFQSMAVLKASWEARSEPAPRRLAERR
ncbi:hypothetical protein JCM10450v2_001001 [Rhodotorula kratochvilovae]